MTVRTSVYGVLNVTPLTSLAPGGLHSAAALVGAVPTRPYVVYRMQDELPTLNGDDRNERSTTIVQVWAYDDPGSYVKIEAILKVVRGLFENAAGLRARWAGDSVELADDEQKAITKNASFEVGVLG